MPEHAFYSDLAPWWPLISPVEEYEEETVFVAELLRRGEGTVREVLELGSGGGHTAYHLRDEFELTFVDRSPEMLAVGEELHPGRPHVVGDMRDVRLGRTFDAVLLHDAVAYLTTVEDLRSTMATAAVHCRPGGVVVALPDDTRENWQPGTDHGGSDAPDGRAARYLEWSWDPDPDDCWTLTAYSFLLREADGSVRSVQEVHTLGLFGRDEWLDAMDAAGFDAEMVPEANSDPRPPRDCFVGVRRAGA